MWAEPGKRMCSNVQAVFLTDEAEPGGAVVVIQASITVKVSTVFIPSKTVPSPAVRLPRSPSPALNPVWCLVHPLPPPSSGVRQTDPVQLRDCITGHKVPLLVVTQNDQVGLLCFTPVSGPSPGLRITAEEVTVGLKHSPTHRTTTTCS